ncbi:peptide/nickel transport system permease protein [Streptomyces olivoverticillatus]|uniref:Peptide/nickel transport system permease protein n=1 Tax=Streptomyces olivoverticillatus TaxID=66427 RepID=A0A7W7PHW5_9ACTN|nr:ABC transporter permease [Streptomyces olivoverticillatus]MBB4891501.1 peptide/nickel transport system permease protein [Streptomyces olivoverticillatus]
MTSPSPAAPATEPGTAPAELIGRSPGQLMRRRFRRDRAGVVSAFVVVFFFLVAVGAPLISMVYGKDPTTTYGLNETGLLNQFGYPVQPNGGISGRFWFGLEPTLGRDVLTQLAYGIRTSLLIAAAATALCVVTGVLVGVTAGYLGGRTDYFLGRFIDLLLAFPQQLSFVAFTPVVYALFVSPEKETPTYLRVLTLILVLWALGWMGLARLLRGQVLSLREREFVEAAKVTGASPWRIITRELLPNLWTPILVQSTLMLPTLVTAEAGLSFIGVGVVEPTPDWGRMFANGAKYYESDVTYIFFPGLAMIIFVVAFNLLGDSVRDAFDPRTRR